MSIPSSEFKACTAWAKEMLQTGSEPPWRHYRLMQLIDAIEAIEAGVNVTIIREDSLEQVQRQDADRPQGAKVYRLETVPPRRDGIQVQLPM